MQELETNYIDLRYESYRIKDRIREQRLLNSIVEKGIRQPVSGILVSQNNFILLDGFKRLRCAQKINLPIVNIEILGTTENQAILNLIRLSNSRNLTTLEEAILLNQVFEDKQLTKSEIARELDCSPAWVSVRLGILDGMSEVAREAIFSGNFPLRSYMYTLRSFTRVKGISKKNADNFIKQVSGKNLSTRDIEKLAYAYFNGSEEMEKQVEQGNLKWILDKMNNVPAADTHTDFNNDSERKMIHNLELIQKYMNFINRDLYNKELKSANFIQNACLLIKGILDRQENFIDKLRNYYVQRESETNC